MVADAREIPAADAVIFAVKMRDTETRGREPPALVGKGAAIFTFQNGVESADRIGGVLGAGSVVPGVARIGSHYLRAGRDQADRQVRAPRVRRARRQAERAHGGASQGLHAMPASTAMLTANIQRELWMKFAMLAPLAGMTALTRGPDRPGARPTRKSRALLEAAVEETVAVGGALKTGLTRTMRPDVKLIDGLPKRHDGVDGARSAGRQADRDRCACRARRAARPDVRRAGADRTRSSPRRSRPSPTASRRFDVMPG